LCIAEFESTFNTSAINTGNWDKSSDYGLFQLSNKYWCDDPNWKDGPEQKACGVPCKKLLDDDITDDLMCVDVIIRDTEAFKGKGTGLSAWVAYGNRCKNQDLNAYIAECNPELDKVDELLKQEHPVLPEGSVVQDIVNLLPIPANPGGNDANSPKSFEQGVKEGETEGLGEIPGKEHIRDFGKNQARFYTYPYTPIVLNHYILPHRQFTEWRSLCIMFR